MERHSFRRVGPLCADCMGESQDGLLTILSHFPADASSQLPSSGSLQSPASTTQEEQVVPSELSTDPSYDGGSYRPTRVRLQFWTVNKLSRCSKVFLSLNCSQRVRDLPGGGSSSVAGLFSDDVDEPPARQVQQLNIDQNKNNVAAAPADLPPPVQSNGTGFVGGNDESGFSAGAAYRPSRVSHRS